MIYRLFAKVALQLWNSAIIHKLFIFPSISQCDVFQENIEQQLDKVDKDLGSVRMTLRRYNAL